MAQVVGFDAVLKAEHAVIGSRRRDLTRKAIVQIDAKADQADSGDFDTVGIALSGGGIRSAAFCLGAMQAFDEYGLIGKADYLSSVSGGGYTAASVTTAMTRDNGTFPFAAAKDDFSDPKALGHVRNFSNYLFPDGKRDFVVNLAIYLRGIAANLLMVVPVILLLAAFTIWANPDRNSLLTPGFAWAKLSFFDGNFGVTISLAWILVGLFLAWSVYRSVFKGGASEFDGPLYKFAAWSLVALAATAFCELQPVAVNFLYRTVSTNGGGNGVVQQGDRLAAISSWAAPIFAAISLFAKKIADVLKLNEASEGLGALLKRTLSKLAVWAAALALPVFLWIFYLLLVFWGIPDVGKGEAPETLWGVWRFLALPRIEGLPAFAGAYAFIALLAMGLAWPLLTPNANSLHRLYRDRLGKTFLFRRNPAREGEFLPGDDLKLSGLSAGLAPYHLINAALNVQASERVNQRGRNADFFIFSPLFCGSDATGYCATEEVEKNESDLYVSTAMAISGAAISSNMGSASIAPLAPTLALLNLRLGYWMRNFGARRGLPQMFYLAAEMFGWLDECSNYIYLTDGGHIENLGVYALLRRRCRLIIAVDAEADPDLNFGALVKLERYARIDLGIRIELPWDKLRENALKALNDPAGRNEGPHCAIGTIDYADGGQGILVYVKSSLSGDENDYVRDYARRYPQFPHETTADQFFSEEQFEVYRALGFHAVKGMATGRDLVQTASGLIGLAASGDTPVPAAVGEVRELFGLPPAANAQQRPTSGPTRLQQKQRRRNKT